MKTSSSNGYLSLWSAILLLLLLGLSLPSFAHNGAVALAYPVEGITVDGDLSDWPEGDPRQSNSPTHRDWGM